MAGTPEREELSAVKRALLEIRDLRTQIAQLEAQQRESIAIVGAGLRFPGGVTDLDSYWRLLAEGVDAIGPIPAGRWDLDAYYDPEPGTPGRMYTKSGGFLHDIDQFDPRFFDISPREAERMDPQQRLLLETAWEALERAGIAADHLTGSSAGVFIGIANSDYFRLLAAEPDNADLYLSTGSAFSIAAGRLAYLLGLTGPALAIDTACSSSLVAVHLAVQSLRRGECDLALSGGANLILSPEANISFSHARMMARDGRCKTFDAAADGYVRSEGCAVVVLKRLSDALAAGDPVLAVIRGSAVNQDGRSNGLTAPNGPAQEAVIRAALSDAGLQPADVHYVETHGTGTALGDPIEVRALGAALGARSKSDPLLIGTVKSNLGHTEAAAGIAGLLKVVLMLRYAQVPPSLHFVTPSPHIPWETLPVQVPTTLSPWPSVAVPRVAGVSSFGFSGTNAHLLLESPPVAPPRAVAAARPLQLLTLSANTTTALNELASCYASHLLADPDVALADVAFTAGQGRAQRAERLAVVAANAGEAADYLRAAAAGDELTTVRRGRAWSEPPQVAFLFTGQGAQYPNMGRQLYDHEPVFRRTLEHCADLLTPYLNQPLLELLFAAPDGPQAAMLNETAYTQPALFALEYALAELWQAWGIQPAAVAGHSLGEYVAACVAGVLSLEDALRLVAMRGRLMGSLPAGGAMAAVFASERRTSDVLGELSCTVAIAAVNGPASVVLSGAEDRVAEAVEKLRAGGIEARTLSISLAGHSALVEPILDDFEAEVATASLLAPSIVLVSGLTGRPVSADVTSARYWRRQLREPVRFGAALETLCELGCNAFIEMGPHPVLLGMARHAVGEDSGLWLPSLRRERDDWEQLLESLGDLYLAGSAIDWKQVATADARRIGDLPTYPFQRQSYWAAPMFRTETVDATQRWEATLEATRRQAEQGPLDLDAGAYPARWQALDELATAYILRALDTLKLFQAPGERHKPEAVIERGIVQPAFQAVLMRWFSRLAAEGLLAHDDGEFVAVGTLPAPAIEPVEAKAAQALAGLEPLLDYAIRSGRQLAAALAGSVSPLDLLFPGGSYATSDFMYQEWAVARYLNAMIRTALESLSGSVRNRPLRVLELGAGTGGTSAQVLPGLPPERTIYDFTDVSDFFLARARERFAGFPFVRYGLLDIERSPAAQGYDEVSYDVVIAANVLHATRDLDRTLKHVRELLAPGGVLLLLEATNHPHWFDITIGLIEGWQAFEDAWRGDNPLLSVGSWEAALHAAGFTGVVALPSAEAVTESIGQHVFLARAPGDVSSSGTFSSRDTALAYLAPSTNGVVTPESHSNSVGRQLQEALPGERHDILAGHVGKIAERVLRAKPGWSIARDQSLLELGIDSLMAVELRDQLGQSLGLATQLPVTLIFDYPTTGSIAMYLEHEVLWPRQRADASPDEATAAHALTYDEVAALTDEEIERRLAEKLKRL